MALLFPFERVLEFVEFNKSHNQSPSYSQQHMSQGELNADRALHLVGDQGVYLMTGTKENKPIPKDQKKLVGKGDKMDVLYAIGCNPRLDDDFYKNKRYLFGGDDGVENIPLSVVEDFHAFIDDKGIQPEQIYFKVTLTPETMDFAVEGRR